MPMRHAPSYMHNLACHIHSHISLFFLSLSRALSLCVCVCGLLLLLLLCVYMVRADAYAAVLADARDLAGCCREVLAGCTARYAECSTDVSPNVLAVYAVAESNPALNPALSPARAVSFHKRMRQVCGV